MCFLGLFEKTVKSFLVDLQVSCLILTQNSSSARTWNKELRMVIQKRRFEIWKLIFKGKIFDIQDIPVNILKKYRISIDFVNIDRLATH